MPSHRRSFLKSAAALPAAAAVDLAQSPAAPPPAPKPADSIAWPRPFTGAQLQQIAFPLGGLAAGSISLGGRGQLRDWEIFNRPDKGNAPAYVLPSIWVQLEGKKPIARVLESKYLPPYEGSSGLGSNNTPGMPRLEGATFTGAFPLAKIDFKDRRLPVKVSLEAFSPFIPLDEEESGLPVAILRYTVTNPNPTPATVALCYSIDNPIRVVRDEGAARPAQDRRTNEIVKSAALHGIFMTHPGLADDHPLQGDFSLAALPGPEISAWRGWPQGRWWNSPLLFWDEFAAHGRLGEEPEPHSPVAALCQRQTLQPQATATFTFILAWRFPNRTPERCGWYAPKGHGKDIIGNHYARRFSTSWFAAEHLAAHLKSLEARTRAFVHAVASSSLPGAVKDAAMSNLSTLVTTTSFRTADGEFHGFEGVGDKSGCCHGSCTHVWNYEPATAYLFPRFAHSLRNSSFGYSMDERGGQYFREALPPNLERGGIIAADGQMGQIMKVWLDYRLSGDRAWLASFYPRVKKALEFAWLPGSWDADQDGVMEGVQHNTYDVEFYGPNPMCGVYYLGALRATEEMARVMNDAPFAERCAKLFQNGANWINVNLYNGEYYIQKVRGTNRDQVAKGLISDMGSDQSENPEYQMGDGCLADQLVGQYQADLCGLGPLLPADRLRRVAESVYKYNFKKSLADHENVQRTFALNDEAALLVCDYGKGTRPRIPFPYYAELFTGLEYVAAALMITSGLVPQGLEVIESIRKRYDGQRRNPWNEAECGHHYARAMAAWSAIPALSGWDYNASTQSLHVKPRLAAPTFRSFFSTANAWGTFEKSAGLTITVLEGELHLAEINGTKLAAPVRVVPGKPYKHA